MITRSASLLIAVFSLFAFIPTRAHADLEDTYRQWTYSVRAQFSQAEVTYIAPDLIDEWLANEKSPTAVARIKTLKETIAKHGYYVYFIHFKAHAGYGFSMAPVNQKVYLNITERTPTRYYPVAYSGNLDGEMIFDHDYYGVVAFELPQDEFAFQTLTIDFTRTPKHQLSRPCRNCSDNPWCCPAQALLPFSFAPNGAPKANRGGSVSADTVVGILKSVLQIVTRLPKG